MRSNLKPAANQIQLLTSVPSAPRSTLQRDALKTAKGYEREARRRIQQMNIAAADLDIKAPKRGGGQQLGSMDELFDGGRELRSRGNY